MCKTIGCRGASFYGPEGDSKPTFCKKHKTDGMVIIKRKICENEGCKAFAICGFKDGDLQFCKKHKTEDMIIIDKKWICEVVIDGVRCIKSKKYGFKGGSSICCEIHKEEGMILLNKGGLCKFPDCDTIASFNYEGKPIKYCDFHREDGMINVSKRRCLEEGCDKTATFNLEGLKPEYCFDHKPEGAIDVRSTRCLKCTRQAKFNFPTIRTPILCGDHKEVGMVNVKERQCVGKPGEPCLRNAFYNFEGLKANYCGECSLEGMVLLKKQKCITEGCKTEACFNLEGLKPLYCKSHKTLEMVNVKAKKCKGKKGCKRRAYYNLEGLFAEFCSDCKTPEMINVNAEYCIEEGCDIGATYGYPDKSTRLYCYDHRKDGCVKDPGKKCITCKIEKATYGVSKATHCEAHHEKGERNLLEKPCINCGLLNILHADRYCDDCSKYRKKYVLNKEEQVIYTFLLENGYDFLYNKLIEKGECVNYKPDFRLTSKNKSFNVIIEVDEDQHAHRHYNCEEVRMFNISQSIGPVIFIRYNPNEFKFNDKKTNFDIKYRILILKRYLDYFLNLSEEDYVKNNFGLLSCLYLFYDDFNFEKLDFKCYDYFRKLLEIKD